MKDAVTRNAAKGEAGAFKCEGTAGLCRNGCKTTAGLSKPGRSHERYGKGQMATHPLFDLMAPRT